MNKLLLIALFLISCDRQTEQLRSLVDIQNDLRAKDTQSAERKIETLLSQKIEKKLRMNLLVKQAEINTKYLLNHEKAIQLYKKSLAHNNSLNNQITIYQKIADIYYYELKKYPQAESYYRKLSSFIPKLDNHSDFITQIGLGKIEQKKFEEGRKILGTIEVNDPNYSKAIYNIALSFLFQKNWESVLVHLKRYIESEKDLSKITFAKYLIANSYENMENLEKAYSVYYSILTDYPEPEIIKRKLKSVYERRVARKR